MAGRYLLFAFYGVSGAGKTIVLNTTQQIGSDVKLHIKDSTKVLGDGEPRPTDLRLISNEEFNACQAQNDYELTYQKYGARYAIVRQQLLDAFTKKEAHCVIIRDITALETFVRSYPHTKTVYFHVDPAVVRDRLAERGEKRVKERLQRIDQEYKEFIENNTLFDHIVLNAWSVDDAVRQLQRIIADYRR
ncbi:MAG TPA: hypothetical protein VLN59_05145 [Burkholderiales bacterium]|nr:hypothetical protein [Burkholderiales bacterium]